MESRKAERPSPAPLTRLPSDRTLQKQAWAKATHKSLAKAQSWKPKPASSYRNVGPSNSISVFSPDLATPAPIGDITTGIGSHHFQQALMTDIQVSIARLL